MHILPVRRTAPVSPSAKPSHGTRRFPVRMHHMYRRPVGMHVALEVRLGRTRITVKLIFRITHRSVKSLKNWRLAYTECRGWKIHHAAFIMRVSCALKRCMMLLIHPLIDGQGTQKSNFFPSSFQKRKRGEEILSSKKQREAENFSSPISFQTGKGGTFTLPQSGKAHEHTESACGREHVPFTQASRTTSGHFALFRCQIRSSGKRISIRRRTPVSFPPHGHTFATEPDPDDRFRKVGEVGHFLQLLKMTVHRLTPPPGGPSACGRAGASDSDRSSSVCRPRRPPECRR